MNKRYSSGHGFTIVELLIVIVVIGILAAITLVAYNGVQASAYNVQIKSVVSSYRQSLLAYSSVNGSYPPVPSEATPSADDRVCLGTGYADHTNDAEPDCGNSGYPSIEYAPFNTALQSIVSLPIVSERTINTPYQATTFTGATFIREDGFTVSGQPNPYYIMYVLIGGNQPCGQNVVEENSGADPFPSMKPSAQDWSWSDGSTTMCVVAMPNP